MDSKLSVYLYICTSFFPAEKGEKSCYKVRMMNVLIALFDTAVNLFQFIFVLFKMSL